MKMYGQVVQIKGVTLIVDESVTTHPDILDYHILQVTHPEYEENIETWQKISILRKGAPAIKENPEVFLKKLPGEDDKIYEYRISNIAYTPVFTQAIKEFVAALVSQPLHVSFGGGDKYEELWNEFRNDIDGKGQDEISFISRLFSQFLLFGRCWLLVNREQQGLIKSKLDEQKLAKKPFIQIVPPEQVINWGDDKEYAITFEKKIKRELFEEPLNYACWQVWTANEVSKYETEIELDQDGNIFRFKNWKGNWVFPTDKENTEIPRTEVYTLELSRPALMCWEVITELWSGKNAYLKQIQHTRIESGWTQSGSVAGQLQRVLTPYAAPADDPRVLTEDVEDIEVGNEHVLIGADYKIVETTGQAVDTLTNQLEAISTQIKDISSMGYLTHRMGANQSGEAKKVDMSLMQNNIKTFGKLVCQVYEQALIMVAEYMDLPTEISVQGLDNFEVDELTAMVTDTKVIMEFENRIAPTALKKWFTRLSVLMAGSVSQEIKDSIVEEMEADEEQLDASIVDGLKDSYGMDDEQIKFVLDS